MIYAASYVLAIALVNWGFVHLPLVHGWPPMSLAVGAVFVLRDFAQREIGHRVLLAMVLGGLLSWIMADPVVAGASIAAFIVSEGTEWAIYTLTGKPFAERVVWSVLGSAPLDSALFLGLIGHFSLVAAAVMTLSKLVGALATYQGLALRRLA
jgi:hypothetical protein